MIIDGKAIASLIQEELKAQISLIKGRSPCLAVILVGNHPPSQIYVNRKISACKDVGIVSIKRELPPTITEGSLKQEIDQLNEDPSVDGILVQLPLPQHIDPKKVSEWISPKKDVDGFHPTNVGKLLSGQAGGFVPCTPLGVKELLTRSGIDVTGKHALIIGRSNIVGKPMAALLMQSMPGGNATVTIAHRHSQNLPELCRQADIIVVAIGQPNFLSANMVKEGAVVIDVGINKVDDPSRRNGYKIVGDADFQHIKDKCTFITPVPGGVGPMTIAMLLSNTLQSYFMRQSS